MPENTSPKIPYRSILSGLAFGLVIDLAFFGGYIYRDRFVEEPTSEASFALLQEADGLLANNYFGEIPDEQQRVYGAIRGLTASLGDPYTIYVEPQTHEVESTNLAGSFGGIGAELSRDEEGRFLLMTVYRDGPGYKDGLRDGDILVAIDRTPVDESDPGFDVVISAIRGEIGQPVLLTIERDGDTLDIEVIRDEIAIPAVVWRLLEEDPRIGYIRLSRFTARAPEELNTALDELSAQGASAYILDLRGNGGGLVDSSTQVLDEFLNGGIILSEERRNGEPRIFRASPGGAATDQPLVVLVDNNTASASEIVAGALQDRERALIIGHQTFGKGSVQVILELSDGSSLHITSARWPHSRQYAHRRERPHTRHHNRNG